MRPPLKINHSWVLSVLEPGSESFVNNTAFRSLFDGQKYVAEEILHDPANTFEGWMEVNETTFERSGHKLDRIFRIERLSIQ